MDLHPEQTRCICKSTGILICEIRRVDITLGPEMKSTGEVMGKDVTLEKALYKGLLQQEWKFKNTDQYLMTVSDKDKEEAMEIAKRFHEIGYRIISNRRNSRMLTECRHSGARL